MSDLPPVVTTTTTVYGSTQQLSSVTLVTISPDEKTICVDWAEIERQAQGADPYLRPLAKALLAVRDKNYQTIGHQ